MKRLALIGCAFLVVLVGVLLFTFSRHGIGPVVKPGSAPAVASVPAPKSSPSTETSAHPSLLYGRVTTKDGATYEGRLRFGGDQEAFWGDYFNGVKNDNPWAALVPPERLPQERQSFEILGMHFGTRTWMRDLGRLFMARFGDIARIEAHGTDVQVTLKSGSTFHLRRMDASDFDDGVRVWDAKRGGVNLDSMQIQTIDLLPAPSDGDTPNRLYGTVSTRQGKFTGFLQWNRTESMGSDQLRDMRFDAIRSIARGSNGGSVVTLMDGTERELFGSSDVGNGNHGVYVDDPRYGRVLVSWDAFERVDLGSAGSGPAYADFPKGLPLKGSVTLRDGRRFAGRLVYDLDESETTQTLDAPSQGVDYTIPFGLVLSIVLPEAQGAEGGPARVTLQDGEELQLERAGDLGEMNAGILIFEAGGARQYVSWDDVQRVDFDRPPAMYPPLEKP